MLSRRYPRAYFYGLPLGSLDGAVPFSQVYSNAFPPPPGAVFPARSFSLRKTEFALHGVRG